MTVALKEFSKASEGGLVAVDPKQYSLNSKKRCSPSESLFVDRKLLWSPHNIDGANMNLFRLAVNEKYNTDFKTYDELYQWSIDNISVFWEFIWEFCGVRCSQPFQRVVDEAIPINNCPQWFFGSRLNYAENLLYGKLVSDEHPALIYFGEGHLEERVITFSELRDLVSKYAASLRALNVQKGDRVVGYLPNCTETAIYMLAAASIGAIWSGTSPDFGRVGVVERFHQIQPVVMFSVNAVRYNGKIHDHLGKLAAVVEGLPTLKHVIVLPFISEHSFDLTEVPNSMSHDAFITFGKSSMSDSMSRDLIFEPMLFNDPQFILFSSGTTGHPKCIVHSVGGTLLQHKKEHILHCNFSENDRFLQYTTAGWMMWNWALSALACGTTVVLYDGSPFVPSVNHFWGTIHRLGITVFGTSAKYLSVLQETAFKPGSHYELNALRMILSTGSPLAPDCYDFVYESIKKDLLLGSMSGGTDIVSLFLGPNPVLPVYRGQLQCRCLGMAVDVYDEDGNSVLREHKNKREEGGVPGDLVCRKPFPSMPVFFWGDDPEKRTKYREAYFNRFPDTWYHGDYLVCDEKTGGWIMLGRSDGTLNPAGVRFGSAELYVITEKYEEIADCLAVGQRVGVDERVILFVKMKDEFEFTEALVGKLKAHIRQELSPRHVPAVILPIEHIPYTINGKKVEVAVKRILSGETVVPNGAIANPQHFDVFYKLRENELK